jgi:hypothetical protein
MSIPIQRPTLVEQDFIDAATLLGCSVAAVKAVAEVEARGGGFDPEGFPKTLFEGHWFHRLTNGRFSQSHPTLSFPRWDRAHYGRTWQAEKTRLQQAVALDREAALQSASWGMFQIMGFNHKACGFENVQQFVNAMVSGERGHLLAFVRFIQTNNLARFMQQQDWASFAHRYNGPGYKQNKYDEKLARAFAKHSRG